MNMAKLFMVLLVYNEEANLRRLLASLELVFARMRYSGHEHAYIIVDDGSKDTSPRILEKLQASLPLTVITHSLNQGLGPTIRDGLKRASVLAEDNDIVFAMDADNTHPPGLLIRMTEMILEGNDVVIASRYRPGSRVVGLSRLRRLMSGGARAIFQTIFPIPGVRDYTCGYRAYRASTLKRAFVEYGDQFVEQQGFQCMAEILLRLAAMGVLINEVPMILRYDLKGGQSKMRIGRTVVNTITLLLKRRFAR